MKFTSSFSPDVVFRDVQMRDDPMRPDFLTSLIDDMITYIDKRFQNFNEVPLSTFRALGLPDGAKWEKPVGLPLQARHKYSASTPANHLPLWESWRDSSGVRPDEDSHEELASLRRIPLRGLNTPTQSVKLASHGETGILVHETH